MQLEIRNGLDVDSQPSWLAGRTPDGSEFNGASVIPVAAATAIIASVLVALRFYARAKILGAIHLEDWFILASLFFGIGLSVVTCLQPNYGLGRHFHHVWPMYSDYVKVVFATGITYSISMYLTKVSILCLYIRIFTYEAIQTLSKIMLGLVVLSHTWIVCSILTTCVPTRALWDMAVEPTYCHPQGVFWANAAINMGTDLLIFALPLPVIFTLRLPSRQKIGLYVVFSLAFGVCAISAVRLENLVRFTRPADQSMDVTWTSVPIANLNCAEVHAAIVCACLATLKPFFTHMFPRLQQHGPPSNDEKDQNQRDNHSQDDHHPTGVNDAPVGNGDGPEPRKAEKGRMDSSIKSFVLPQHESASRNGESRVEIATIARAAQGSSAHNADDFNFVHPLFTPSHTLGARLGARESYRLADPESGFARQRASETPRLSVPQERVPIPSNSPAPSQAPPDPGTRAIFSVSGWNFSFLAKENATPTPEPPTKEPASNMSLSTPDQLTAGPRSGMSLVVSEAFARPISDLSTSNVSWSVASPGWSTDSRRPLRPQSDVDNPEKVEYECELEPPRSAHVKNDARGSFESLRRYASLDNR